MSAVSAAGCGTMEETETRISLDTLFPEFHSVTRGAPVLHIVPQAFGISGSIHYVRICAACQNADLYVTRYCNA